MDFLWHSVSEQEKKEIQKEAKKIMESFSKKLSDLDKKVEEPIIERGEGMRLEQEGKECDETFRDMLFKNAPQKNKDFIIAEKKKW
ncbi:MAG: hypothetical protein AABY22_22190 [Nanoarchaeota archaeon]